jgi:hypothetical protein
MTYQPNRIDDAIEEMRVAMLEAARATAEANRLDERRKIVRAHLIKKFRADGKAVGESEQLAMATEQYEAAVNEHYLAELDALTKKATSDHLKIRWESWRTRAANKRAEMNA